MAKVEISLKGLRNNTVKIDGHEISDVTAIGLLAQTGDAPTVSLEIWATDVTIDGDASVELVAKVLDASGMEIVPTEEDPDNVS